MPSKVRKLTGGLGGWTIDYQADAAYLEISNALVDNTVNYGIVNVDVDQDGNAVGIELLTLMIGDGRGFSKPSVD